MQVLDPPFPHYPNPFVQYPDFIYKSASDTTGVTVVFDRSMAGYGTVPTVPYHLYKMLARLHLSSNLVRSICDASAQIIRLTLTVLGVSQIFCNKTPVVRYLRNFSRRFDLHDSIFLDKSRCRDSGPDRGDIFCNYKGQKILKMGPMGTAKSLMQQPEMGPSPVNFPF
jgi:hypothetical protein